MVGQYRQFRMPLDAYQKLIAKRNKIEDKLFSISRKKVRVPLTRLMGIVADKTVFFSDDELVQTFMRKRGGGPR